VGPQAAEEEEMGAFFGKEIVEGAIQIEKNGQLFYRNVAQKESRPAVRDVFAFLAEEEGRHVAELQYLLTRLAEPPDTWEREDFALYLDDLVAEHIFREDGSGERKALQVGSELAAVDLGIQFEKDTILLWHELHALVRPEEHRVVDDLVQWEKDHLVRLVRLKKDLAGTSSQR
jgi:rubrerythrin